MTAPDHIARAAEVLNQSVVRQSVNDDISITVYADGLEFEEALARALDDAGRLVTPEHDAAVIEKFLRERDTPSVRIENPEAITPLLAKAWDQGFKQGGPMHDVHLDDPDAHTRNPYRKGENDA